jgi:hypothetical protein
MAYVKRTIQSREFTLLSVQEVLAWTHMIEGRTQEDSAKMLNCSVPTVVKWRKKVIKFMGENVDKVDQVAALKNMGGLALRSTAKNLKKQDPQFTSNYWRGMGVWQDKSEVQTKEILMTDEEIADAKRRVLDIAAKRVAGVCKTDEAGEISSGE